jgi:hypothetical protein
MYFQWKKVAGETKNRTFLSEDQQSNCNWPKKKPQSHQSDNVPYPPNFCTLTSYINQTLSLKALDMQKNFRTCSESSHYWVVMKPTCSTTNKVIFFAIILDCKKRSLIWNKIMSHLTTSKDASMKTFTYLSIHNFISLNLILPQ